VEEGVAIAVAYEASSGSTPATPTGLAVVNNATSPTTALNVSWNASSGATSYILLRASSLAGTFTSLATGITGTSYVDNNGGSGLTQGTEYAYEVEAVNSSGTSAASSGVAWATAPSAPTGLSLTPTTNPNEFNASWNAYSPNSNISLAINPYIVRFETPEGAGNWQSQFAAGTSVTTSPVLTPGAQYGVEVSVTIDSSNGDWSGTIQGPWSSEQTVNTYPIPKDTLVRQAVVRGCTW
jgi:hypothetical protein